MDTGDRKLFTESLQRATEQHTGAALDDALDELGWHDALEDDRRDAIAVLFELQGAANVTSAAFDDVMATGLGQDVLTTAIVLPRIGQAAAPGRVVEGRLIVHGVATGGLERSTTAAIAHGTQDIYLTTVESSQLEVRPAPGLDPALGLFEVRGDLAFDASTSELVTDAWAGAVATGRVALAYELVGASRAMLRLAREHALERVQFGRPISGFQAIRHRLAESLVAIEAAQACADAAFDDSAADTAADKAAEIAPFAATLAKAVAGANARVVARHAQQVLGGMGYTTEYPLHLYVRRTLVLDQLLGAGRSLTREIGEQLLASGKLPEMLPL
jgi:hypothetical protein